MLRPLCIAVYVAFAPAAHAASAEQMEANKKAVAEFYELAVNKKDFEAAAKFLGPRYREKFPNAHSDTSSNTSIACRRRAHAATLS
jgi:hypothetical protein